MTVCRAIEFSSCRVLETVNYRTEGSQGCSTTAREKAWGAPWRVAATDPHLYSGQTMQSRVHE